MPAQRRPNRPGFLRRNKVTPTRPGAEEQGTAPEPPQDEYPTETFDAIRLDSSPISDPGDDGADVVDEWEQALRGDASERELAAESPRGARSRRGGNTSRDAAGTEQDDASSQIFDRIRRERTTGAASDRANGGAEGLFGSARVRGGGGGSPGRPPATG